MNERLKFASDVHRQHQRSRALFHGDQPLGMRDTISKNDLPNSPISRWGRCCSVAIAGFVRAILCYPSSVLLRVLTARDYQGMRSREKKIRSVLFFSFCRLCSDREYENCDT